MNNNELIIYPAKPKWLLLAEKEALLPHIPSLGLEHIFIGLLAFREGIASRVLRRDGFKLRKLQADWEVFNGFWGTGYWGTEGRLQHTDRVERLLRSLEGTTLSSGLALLNLLDQEPDNGFIANVFLKGKERKLIAEETERLLSDQSLIHIELEANDKEISLDEYWESENGFRWDLLQGDSSDLKRQVEDYAAEIGISFLTPEFLTLVILERNSRIAEILSSNTGFSLDPALYRRSIGHKLRTKEKSRNFSHCSMRAMETSWEIAQSFGQKYIRLGNILDALIRERGELIKNVRSSFGDELPEQFFSEKYFE